MRKVNNIKYFSIQIEKYNFDKFSYFITFYDFITGDAFMRSDMDHDFKILKNDITIYHTPPKKFTDGLINKFTQKEFISNRINNNHTSIWYGSIYDSIYLNKISIDCDEDSSKIISDIKQLYTKEEYDLNGSKIRKEYIREILLKRILNKENE